LSVTIRFSKIFLRSHFKFEILIEKLNTKFEIEDLRSQTGFPVILSAGSHPFPSRTRKLSLLEPMVLRG
jgi:hypothetical protein